MEERGVRKWYPILAIAAMIVFTIVVYPRLPEQLPLHWNLQGDIDGFGPRSWGAWLLPALALVVLGFMRLLPRLDPRRENYDKFGPTYDLVIDALVTFLAVLHVIVLGAALGWPIAVTRVMPVVMGLLFIVFGNVLPRARPNWWFGIRTPWTLSNDRVWERTHRVGGYLLVGAGVACMATAFLPASAAGVVTITAIAASAAGSIVYSYFAWKQETSK
jgi:uncharacterized membrane protein